jgi:hypothetical protein
MNINKSSAILLNLTGAQIAKDVAKNLEPLIEQQVNKVLDQKTEDEESPLTMAEAADFVETKGSGLNESVLGVEPLKKAGFSL